MPTFVIITLLALSFAGPPMAALLIWAYTPSTVRKVAVSTAMATMLTSAIHVAMVSWVTTSHTISGWSWVAIIAGWGASIGATIGATDMAIRERKAKDVDEKSIRDKRTLRS